MNYQVFYPILDKYGVPVLAVLFTLLLVLQSGTTFESLDTVSSTDPGDSTLTTSEPFCESVCSEPMLRSNIAINVDKPIFKYVFDVTIICLIIFMIYRNILSGNVI